MRMNAKTSIIADRYHAALARAQSATRDVERMGSE
jgi:hypothetical protein